MMISNLPVDFKTQLKKSQEFVRKLDENDGGVAKMGLEEALDCIESALVAGLNYQFTKKSRKSDESRSEFDALVMLQDLKKSLATK